MGKNQPPRQTAIPLQHAIDKVTTMSDVIASNRQIIQDSIVPDIKALQSKQELLANQLEMIQRQSIVQHDAMMMTLDAFRAEMRSEFAAIKANNQVEVMRRSGH